MAYNMSTFLTTVTGTDTNWYCSGPSYASATINVNNNSHVFFSPPKVKSFETYLSRDKKTNQQFFITKLLFEGDKEPIISKVEYFDSDNLTQSSTTYDSYTTAGIAICTLKHILGSKETNSYLDYVYDVREKHCQKVKNDMDKKDKEKQAKIDKHNAKVKKEREERDSRIHEMEVAFMNALRNVKNEK